jgi:Virulence factor membrane-bound polymerase, C-terminal/O-Antigen ligase
VLALAACVIAMAVALISVMWITLLREGPLNSTSQRLSLWRDVLTLIAHEPWLGVGFGQLNFVWTLTPFPARTPNVFDHAHSLPLQLAVEFGWPLTVLILTSVLYALAAHRFNANSALGQRRWLALGMLAVVLLHSLFEYPLWFAHFLLPSALLLALLARPLGVASKAANTAALARTNWLARWPALPAAMGAIAVTWAALGYQQIVAIYRNATEPQRATQLAQTAQSHALFGYYADYAAIMLAGDEADAKLFSRPARAIIDERFLVAWSRSLMRENQPEAAAYLVARAREFPPNPLFTSLPTIPLSSINAASMPRGPASFRQ